MADDMTTLEAWQRLEAKLEITDASAAFREAAFSLFIIAKMAGPLADMAATALRRVEAEIDREHDHATF
jgi:hypothetical protein